MGFLCNEPTQPVAYLNGTTLEVQLAPRTIDGEITRLAAVYGVDERLAREIIRCESEMYPGAVNENKRKDGTVWSRDWYDWQINDHFHMKDMTKMGFDFHDRFDSLEYGFILLSRDGTRHWNASRHCWSAGSG